jgi:hypothetical protein
VGSEGVAVTVNEAIARRIFLAAIAEHRCGELLDALLEGGSATVDAITGQLVIVTDEQLSTIGMDSGARRRVGDTDAEH